jgi:Ni,Fe-hydrogenase I cytochrome b subunit
MKMSEGSRARRRCGIRSVGHCEHYPRRTVVKKRWVSAMWEEQMRHYLNEEVEDDSQGAYASLKRMTELCWFVASPMMQCVSIIMVSLVKSLVVSVANVA